MNVNTSSIAVHFGFDCCRCELSASENLCVSCQIRDALWKTFEARGGPVRDVYVLTDFHTGNLKGYSFVHFKHSLHADAGRPHGLVAARLVPLEFLLRVQPNFLILCS